MIIKNIPIGINPVMINHFNQIQLFSNRMQALFQNTGLQNFVGITQMQSHTLGIFQNSIGSVMATQLHMLKPFFDTQQALHKQMSSELQNVLSLNGLLRENNFLATMGTIPKIDSTIFSIFQNDSFKSVFEHIKNVHIDELLREENNLYQTNIEERLEESDKKLLSDFLDLLQENMPGLKPIIDSFRAKNYPKTVIATIFFIIVYIPTLLTLLAYFSENTNYRVNRENVRVRTTPSTVEKDNIITILHRNIYVEKIDFDESGWIKIRFEMSDGKIEEGWIYRTMLSKIE